MAAKYNFIANANGLGAMDQGVDFIRIVTLTKNSVPIDLTGAVVTFKAKTNYSSATFALEATQGNGMISLSELEGKIYIVVPAVTTALIAAGSYLYSFDMELSGHKYRISEGVLQNTPGVI